MRVLLGVICIGGAVVFLLASVALSVVDVPALIDLWEPVYCDAGDQLSAERYTHPTDDGGIGFSAIYTCTRPNQTTYDATGKAFLVSAGGFTLLLLLGVGLIIWGARDYSRMNPGVIQIPPEAREAYNEALRVWNQTPGAATELTEKLQQLQAAYDQNLITQEEYDQKRAEILREF